MNSLRVAPIVEGHGEVIAVRKLLERIWYEMLQGQFIDVLRPVRQHRTKLLNKPAGGIGYVPDVEEIARVVKLAAGKLGAVEAPVDRSLILILLDADSDCPAELAPDIIKFAQPAAPDSDLGVVLAKVEYETWFVAAADSLTDYLEVEAPVPVDPEGERRGKEWVANRFRGARYSETVDQVRLTTKLDLEMCRSRSPSFDKLCREMESRLG